MKLTLDHPHAINGRPVFVDAGGTELAPAAAIRIIRRDKLKLTVAEFAHALGVSPRTVNGWEQGRPPETAALWNLKSKLNDRFDRIRHDKTTSL